MPEYACECGVSERDATKNRIAALEAENARMREIVAAVAKMDPLSDEARVISGVPGWSTHANLIAKARALLASDDTPRDPSA